MSDNSVDPSGNTEAFRAFTRDAPEEPAAASRIPLVVAGVAVALAIVGVVVWLAS